MFAFRKILCTYQMDDPIVCIIGINQFMLMLFPFHTPWNISRLVNLVKFRKGKSVNLEKDNLPEMG